MKSFGGDSGAATRRGAGFTAVVGAALVACACAKVAVQSEVPEREANETVAALLRAGLSAEKTPAAAGEGTFVVEVDASDAARAFDVLREAGLPRPESTGFADLYAGDRLVPTAAEERARLHAAISGELARSIERVDGVLEARVHLSVPEPDPLGVGPAPTPPRASVLVRYAGASPPYDERSVQRLVAGGVPGLVEANVAVIGARRASSSRSSGDVNGASTPSTTTSLSDGWRSVVGIHVAPSSVAALRATLGVLLAVVFGLSVCLLVALLRRSPHRDRARAEP